MKVVLFCHSLISCWNHGNAHFLRGVVTELMDRGHDVRVFEPRNGWSLTSLRREQGDAAIQGFKEVFPNLRPAFYDPASIDLDAALDGADLVIVHEWSDPGLVRQIGLHRRRGGRYRLLFHDTHHRSVTDHAAMARYRLEDFDGVLAFGRVIAEIYRREGWSQRAWTWHEAADTRLFRPILNEAPAGHLVWIGNWGDDERSRELQEFLLDPVGALSLRARVYGVRYPKDALAALTKAGIAYAGWLPNHDVPRTFARFRVTVHVPRRPYVAALPGIPTIRMFEALACGIPLVSAPWPDSEGLFSPGRDFLVARNGEEMKRHLAALLDDQAMAHEIAQTGRRTILARHTCGHRVDELLVIAQELGLDASPPKAAAPPDAEAAQWA